MRLITIPTQSSVSKAFQEFDAQGRMKPSPLYDRIVAVKKKLIRFTILTQHWADTFLDRCCDRKKSAAALMTRTAPLAAT